MTVDHLTWDRVLQRVGHCEMLSYQKSTRPTRAITLNLNFPWLSNQQTWFSITINSAIAFSLPSFVETTCSFDLNFSVVCISPSFSSSLFNWLKYHFGIVAWCTSSFGIAASTRDLYSSKWTLRIWWRQVVLEPRIRHCLKDFAGVLFSSMALSVASLEKL